MSGRPVRPLDPKAVVDANGALYRAHAGDPRPNALYDAAGNRQPLGARDPSQAALRTEWLNAYEAAGGKMEGRPTTTPQKVGNCVQPCPKQPAHLTVRVTYDPLPAPVRGAVVTIEGPAAMQAATNAAGIAEFPAIPPGDYKVTATYGQTDRLVEQARGQVGKQDWAVDVARGSYPEGKNKCNMFVFEMANDAGRTVTEAERFSLRGLRTVRHPPLAGTWAGGSVPGWSSVTSPEPGDIIAKEHQSRGATGHVGIVSYPQPTTGTQSLAEAEHATLDLSMRRQTISAGSDEILENDWGWRPGQTPRFKRYGP